MERLKTFNVEPILESVREGAMVGYETSLRTERGACLVASRASFSQVSGIPVRTHILMLMTRDHIIPKSKGGANHIDNYQPMCAPCNQQNGVKK